MFVFRRVFSRKLDLLKGNPISWASKTKKQQKINFHTVPFLINRRHKGSSKTRLNFEPITSAVVWKIHHSNLCIRFGTWGQRRTNQHNPHRKDIRNTAFESLYGGLSWFVRSTHITNQVDKTKLSCNTPHWRSTAVSLETYPLYPYESATNLTSNSATNPDEFNAVCRSKPNLPNKTD